MLGIFNIIFEVSLSDIKFLYDYEDKTRFSTTVRFFFFIPIFVAYEYHDIFCIMDVCILQFSYCTDFIIIIIRLPAMLLASVKAHSYMNASK
jgi:hypothetical protein